MFSLNAQVTYAADDEELIHSSQEPSSDVSTRGMSYASYKIGQVWIAMYLFSAAELSDRFW
jgi:hypothetical protein